jgi:hypothetical protein
MNSTPDELMGETTKLHAAPGGSSAAITYCNCMYTLRF